LGARTPGAVALGELRRWGAFGEVARKSFAEAPISNKTKKTPRASGGVAVWWDWGEKPPLRGWGRDYEESRDLGLSGDQQGGAPGSHVYRRPARTPGRFWNGE